MTFPGLNRRDFVWLGGAAAALPAASALEAHAGAVEGAWAVPDEGWRLWRDAAASWQNDDIHLPGEFDLAALPVNPPSGGWTALNEKTGIAVTLPGTVEQHFWGAAGTRPYTPDEYALAAKDTVPRNGAWRGVSWWWRGLDIPVQFRGKRITLTIRGARMRAEVFLNRKLVGYSILEELPFVCDLTQAAKPGGRNLLAIRITNPGGRYDWVDGDTIDWGKKRIQRSHGFGGLDRGLTLHADPMAGCIADLWVLNTPDMRTVHAFVKMDGAAVAPEQLTLALTQEKTGAAQDAKIRFAGRGADNVYKFIITAKRAKVWALATPHLYRLHAAWTAPGGAQSVRSRAFGFRWFAPEGLGKNALFRLNGRRIRLYSAISWGYWGLNGLWPTPELAEKEARQAKTLGLNCLNFHRNIGKEDVFAAQDRIGLLRYMEPGGGKFAVGRLPDGVKPDANSVIMAPAQSPADIFCRRFMVAKCTAMVRAFRSHPSLIQYTLQNEIGADFSNPATLAVLDAMRAEDESRIIAHNDGLTNPPTRAAQAWYAPYDPHIHRSDREAWGGWWDEHQGAGDQWYDAFYQGPEHFTYRQPLRGALVEFGEMEGCAVPDNHILAIAQIVQRGGTSYDLADRSAIVTGYNDFLDRWNFRKAFPTTESLFLAIGRKCYESWQQYLENVRINDATDFAVISGWESTAIDNHSGLVDNLRNFKSDPAIIRAGLSPLRAIAKQHSMVAAVGGTALFDLFLFNDTGQAARGALTFSMTDPLGREEVIGRFAVPSLGADRFSALVRAGFTSPVLTHEGRHRFTLSMPEATPQIRDIWVCDPKLPVAAGRGLSVAVAGIAPDLGARLAALPGVALTQSLQQGDVIVASRLDQAVIAAVEKGTPLLVMAQQDDLADAAARALAAKGAFTYDGQVGKLRAPWMGNWYFLRDHPAYAGLPVDRAMGVHYQVPGKPANGLLVDGAGLDVFVGYSRDHDRRVGAGTFTARLGAGKILFQRVPDMNGPMQQRFLRNALAWLAASR
jgi:hypothetical protein